MPNKPIPERAPIEDRFTGLLIEVDGQQALATTAQDGAHIIATGDFVVRYGLRYLGKLHLSVVPGLLALDYGDFLTGEEAWDFLMNRSNLYPRSEVFGYRNDGGDEMIVIKALDLSVPPETLVYNNPNDSTPMGRPTAVIASETAELPERLLEFLPRFSTIDEWQTAL